MLCRVWGCSVMIFHREKRKFRLSTLCVVCTTHRFVRMPQPPQARKKADTCSPPDPANPAGSYMVTTAHHQHSNMSYTAEVVQTGNILGRGKIPAKFQFSSKISHRDMGLRAENMKIACIPRSTTGGRIEIEVPHAETVFKPLRLLLPQKKGKEC